MSRVKLGKNRPAGSIRWPGSFGEGGGFGGGTERYILRGKKAIGVFSYDAHDDGEARVAWMEGKLGHRGVRDIFNQLRGEGFRTVTGDRIGGIRSTIGAAGRDGWARINLVKAHVRNGKVVRSYRRKR